MDDLASNIIDRETALADFDHARDDFEEAFGWVPDDALNWKPEGEDYTIGFLVPHITSVLRMYSGLADTIRSAAYSEIHLGDDHGAAQNLTPGDDGLNKARSIAEMEEAHDNLAANLRDLAEEAYNRQATVYYPGSPEPTPTGAADILSWVTDHYREHIAQVRQMLQGRQARQS